MNDKYPEEIPIETPEPMDVEELDLEDTELEDVSGGLKDDGNCHNTQCC